MEHIIIIGGGGTGAAIAHDLSLRGYQVTLYEKGEFLSGTTGRHHGLLHSGARYAVNDQEAARECIEENQILRKIAPQAIEQNEGLFVAISESDLEYSRRFIQSCQECGITLTKLTVDQALAMEPDLNPGLKLALQVPDASFDAWRLPLHFFATARKNGARLHHFSEITSLIRHNHTISGVRGVDHKSGRTFECRADLVINATGAWAGKITAMAGAAVPIQPGPGVMVAIEARVTDMVVNRLHPAGEGDIIVPQRQLSVLGTTLWLDQDPDLPAMKYEHIQKMIDLCAEMVPAVKNFPIRSAWCAARPLLGTEAVPNPQDISRTFDCFDHWQKDQLQGLISVIGGKATTLRAMAEKTADLVDQKTGRQNQCRTKEVMLENYRDFYRSYPADPKTGRE